MLVTCSNCKSPVDIPDCLPGKPFAVQATICSRCNARVFRLVVPAGPAIQTARRSFPGLPPFP
jgi:hypothetical protein